MAVSDPSLVSHHGQYPAPGLSKHDLVFLGYNLRPPKSEPKFISYRNYKNINFDSLLSDASNLSWGDVVAAESVDLMVSKFNSLLFDLFDKHSPIIKKRVTKRPAPWLSPYIRQLQKQRDYAFFKQSATNYHKTG